LAHTAGNLVIHLIFSTKGRQALITPEIRTDLFAYLGGIIREMHGTALIINGTGDHVHMLIRIRPVQSAAEVARVVKTIRRAGYARNGMRVLPGRRGMALSG
jgi:putative transposase